MQPFLAPPDHQDSTPRGPKPPPLPRFSRLTPLLTQLPDPSWVPQVLTTVPILHLGYRSSVMGKTPVITLARNKSRQAKKAESVAETLIC